MNRGAPLQVVRARKAPASRAFRALVGEEVSVGVTRLPDGEFGLRINLTHRPSPGLELPAEFEGVPVEWVVAGEIRRL